jgi:hypothetical protein
LQENKSSTKITVNSKEWEIDYLKSQNVTVNNKNLSNIAINVGAPSWTSDWAYTTTTVQYLALGVHNSLSDTHVFGKKYTGKNVLQIWGCDLAKNKYFYCDFQYVNVCKGVIL